MDIVLPKAVQSGDVSFAFKMDNVRVYSVTFTGYADVAGNVLYVSEKAITAADVVANNGFITNQQALTANGQALVQ